MAGLKIKKGDNVAVIAGKDKGKTGVVETVLPGGPAKGGRTRGTRVVVTGVNIIKKAVKATAQTKQAGLVEMPAPLHISNVMIVDPKSGKPSRVGYKVTGKGKSAKKIRIAVKSGQTLEGATK